MDMDDLPLYLQIAEAVRSDIRDGKLKPGDRLEPVRSMAGHWNCTIGTIQRAYQELALSGLVTSRAGQGTHIVHAPRLPDHTPLRRASLVHRAEAFLLESLTGGYSLAEIDDAVQRAMDRWRAMEVKLPAPPVHTLRFSGSHDLALTWIASHFEDISSQAILAPTFVGSLGGLIALTEGKADIAGSHLWDEETDDYNLPFVRRLLPGKRVALVTLAHRWLGFIVPPGNPSNLRSIDDLCQSELRFINRQAGSGTRVWFDVHLRRTGLQPNQILGYQDEALTHSETALCVAERRAHVGLGLEASAHAFGLGFVRLTRERYDLVISESVFNSRPIQDLVSWLISTPGQAAIQSLPGYDNAQTGQIQWVE